MTPPLKSGNDSKTEQKSGGVKKPEHMCRKCGKQFPEERQLLNHLSLLCAVVVQVHNDFDLDVKCLSQMFVTDVCHRFKRDY